MIFTERFKRKLTTYLLFLAMLMAKSLTDTLVHQIENNKFYYTEAEICKFLNSIKVSLAEIENNINKALQNNRNKTAHIKYGNRINNKNKNKNKKINTQRYVS